MAGSTLSTDSLSSPSPTPTPSPPPGVSPPRPMPPARPPNNIDEDSELSELTEDDQDGSATVDKRAASAAAHSSSKEIPVASEDDDDDKHSSAPSSPRPTRRQTLNARRGIGPRRKRSSIVPAPMWGWAESKGPPPATPHKDKQEEEEEEEEQSDLPRPMEEEEPEEEEAEEDDEDGEESGGDADGGRKRRVAVRSYVGKVRGGGRRQAAAGKRSQRPAPDDEDDEEAEPVLNGDDDDGSAYGDSYPPSKKKRTAKSKKKNGVKPRSKTNGMLNSEDESVNENTESGSEAPQPQTPPSPSKAQGTLQGPSIASNSAASALTALAAVADAVDPTSPTSLSAAALSAIPSIPPPPISASTTAEATPLRSPSPAPKPRRTIMRHLSGSKRRLPPPLDLKIDTTPDKPVIEDDDMEVDDAEEEAADQSMENGDVDMDGEEADHEEEEDEDEDGEEEVEEAEETSIHDDEEPAQADVEADEEAPEVESDADEEVVEPEGDEEQEQDQDQDQDQDADAPEAEVEGEREQERDEGEERSPDGELDEHEIELQPAHRAEALDALAAIELKFALLREMVYIESMEELAWEEQLVQSATHPEMIHLQKELSKRRDKRLELASRKRSYEVANATQRRKTDEDAVWSWWKFSTEELQTDMISETNRKRRKLERDRRAVERPQPIRRIPLPPHPDMQVALLPPPSLRKAIKSYPFGTRKQNKSDPHHHHSHHSQYPKTLVYPEISTLSSTDIANDLEFLYQNRRILSGYDTHLSGFPLQHFAPAPQRNGSGLGFGISSGLGIARPANSLSVGINGSGLPPPAQSMMGGPPPGMHQHGLGYDQYGDGYGPPSGSGRMRDHSMGGYPHGTSGGSLPQGPSGSVRESTNAYSSFSGPGGRLQQASRMPGYPPEHEMSTIGPPPGPNHAGGGHQLMPHHPYFSQASVGPGGPASNPYPSATPSSGHGLANHQSSAAMKGMNVSGRRSISPVHILPNGLSSANPKNNGTWMGDGMGMINVPLGGSGGKSGDRDGRMAQEDEERERAMRERERSRNRDERDRDSQRDRDFDRRREKEYQELERERAREHQHMQHRQSQQPPTSGTSHMHSGGVPPPIQGSGGVDPHHHHSGHRHAPHHHHVLHRHHQGPQHASSSLPPPNTSGPGAPPITHSPRSTRDYEASRPPSMHSGPGQPHPTEVIMLSSGGKAPQPSAGRDTASQWPLKGTEDAHRLPPDYRNRDRDARDRDARSKMYAGQRPPSRPPMIPLDPLDDRGDRPMAIPFVMAPSHAIQPASSSSHLNGSGIGSSAFSPRGAPPSWNTPAGEDPSYRMPSAPPPSYLDGHTRSPVQGHRYPASGGSHASPLTRMANSSSSSSLHRIGSPPLPSSRVRPPQSPSYLHNPHRSPVTSPKTRPLSPVPNSKPTILSGGAAAGYTLSPQLSGPGRTATPTGHHPPSLTTTSSGGPPSDMIMKNGTGPYPVSSRTASPLMSSLHAPPSNSGRPTMNGGGGSSALDRDRIVDRERHLVGASSPRLSGPSMPLPPPSKLSTAQMVDGH